MQDTTINQVKEIQERFVNKSWTAAWAIAAVGIGWEGKSDQCLRENLVDETRSDVIPAVYEHIALVVVEFFLSLSREGVFKLRLYGVGCWLFPSLRQSSEHSLFRQRQLD
jgi:hypothetical protein